MEAQGSSSHRIHLTTCLGIFLISASVLMMELILTRIFSVKLYYHYAFMVISLALFGSGASGIYVYLFPRLFRPDRLNRHLAFFSGLFAVSIPPVLWCVLRLDFEFSFDPRAILRVLALYAIPAVPFFLSGICVSLAMTHLAQDVSRLYFFDLAGAGAGCLLVIPLLNRMGGPDALLMVSIIASLACMIFAFKPGLGLRVRLPSACVTACLILLLAQSVTHPFLQIRQVKGRDEWGVLFSEWNSFSRITVVEVNQDPKNTWIIMDGDAGTLLPRFDGNLGEWSYVRNSISALAYQLKQDAHPLIVGPGGGIDVITALSFGSRRVTGVEINPIIVNDVMKGRFREFTGDLYSRPGVEIIVDEGRSFLRRSAEKYDIIQATLVDTWAATAAGAFALAENNLYTVEAFEDYFRRLKDDGILTITRWNLDPPQQDLRLVAIARAAMRESGLSNPDQAIMVVRQRKVAEAVECNFLFKKSGFTEAEVRRIEQISRQNGFEILYTPATRPDNPFTKLITAADPASFYATYPFIVTPTYDNSPFYFHTIRFGDLWQSLFLSWESKKTNVGLLVLVIALLSATVLTFLFIFVPLIASSGTAVARRPVSDLGKLSYFVCLGLGFVLIEITLVQKFVLFLGSPVYALSIVLFSILVFSGIGSWFSARLATKSLARSTALVCALVLAIAIAYVWLLPPLLYRYVALSTSAKSGLVVIFLFPLAGLMGMPMPLGIHRLRRDSASLIPWAWGLNASASVLGSILAILIAVYLGFDQALATAAMAYFGAMLIALRDRSPEVASRAQ